MTLTLEQIVQAGQTRPFRWARQADGRYTIFDRPIAEPHNYDGDVFDVARQKAILETTRREEPEGGMWVGHPGFGDTEAPVTGRMVNYRESELGMGRHIADWVDIEPTAFLDIILNRWRSYSVEYRLPNLDAYKGVALLGRSQAFFGFARLNPPKLTDAEMEQLRQDADAWPKTMAARSVNKHPSNPKGTRAMKKAYRQILKGDAMIWQVQETDDDGNVKEWRNLREGEAVEKDDEEMSKMRSAVEEVGQRMGNLEKRMDKVEESIGGGNDDGEDDDEGREEPKGDDDEEEDKNRTGKKKPGATRTVTKVDDKAIRALNERLDKADRKASRARYDGKIDTLVAAGAVIDRAARTAVLDAVMAVDEDKRDTTFEALTKSVRKAPLNDPDADQEIPDNDPLIAGYDEEDQKALRTYFQRLGPNARKVARKELKEYNDIRKATPSAHGVAAGPLNWLEANVDPAQHDAA